MGKKSDKVRLTGPWKNVQAAVWLIGLAVLAFNNWWWPGILVLVALSILLEVIIPKFVPSAIEQPGLAEEAAATPEMMADIQNQINDAPVNEAPRIDLLPLTCPKCGGPIKGHAVKWTSAMSADCPFCGTNLPLKADK